MLKKWLRNKLAGPVYVDCYTTHVDAYKIGRIKSATNYLPGWWKRLLPALDVPLMDEVPNITRKGSTMRHCVGFTDLFKKSFCLPLWSDLTIHVEPAMREGFVWKYADNRSKAGEHPAWQRGDFMPPEHFQHVKLTSPWHLKCEEDINFLFFDPFWPSYTGEEEAIIPPGLINYKYQTATNINMFIRKLPDEARKLEFKFDTPMVFITPLTDRKVILRYHLVSAAEMADIHRPQVAFVDAYVKGKRATIEAEKHNKEEQSND